MKSHAATMLIAAAAWMPAGASLAGKAEIAADLQRQIARCWRIPPEATSRTDAVTLSFRLGRDGSVDGVPTIVENPDVPEYAKDFVISASDAIKACQPYKLPPDQYDLWKEVNVTFHPQAKK